MNMRYKMNEKARKATSAKKSDIIVKVIPRSEGLEIKFDNKSIIYQNKIEEIQMSDYISRDDSIYGMKLVKKR